ncbi:MAG: GreA/GreB family elongation factor [Chthoniobacteraceae bacterium]
MNKSIIIERIIATLTTELEGYARSARAAHAGATDEQNKAENKYDTRGLEASYLARGQSAQATEVMHAIHRYESLDLREFTAQEPIDIGALVELERSGERTVFFIGPLAGGAEVDCEGKPVLVITPQSPLGQQIIGHKQGDRFQIKIGNSNTKSHVVAVA